MDHTARKGGLAKIQPFGGTDAESADRPEKASRQEEECDRRFTAGVIWKTELVYVVGLSLSHSHMDEEAEIAHRPLQDDQLGSMWRDRRTVGEIWKTEPGGVVRLTPPDLAAVRKYWGSPTEMTPFSRLK